MIGSGRLGKSVKALITLILAVVLLSVIVESRAYTSGALINKNSGTEKNPLLTYTVQGWESDYALIQLRSVQNYEELQEVVKFINSNGGKARHIYPSANIVIGIIPKGLVYEKIKNLNKIESVNYDSVNNKKVKVLSHDKKVVLMSWNLEMQRRDSGLQRWEQPEEIVRWSDLGREGVVVEDRFEKQEGKEGGEDYENYGWEGDRWGLGLGATSHFLIGSTSVGIVFPESNGSIDPNQEDWTSEEEALVIAAIRNALDWYSTLDGRAELSWIYDAHYRVPTGYEPISRPHTDGYYWMKDTFEQLGYRETEYSENFYAYLNNMRNTFKTDWAYVAYIVDASNNPNGMMFTDNWQAYAYRGGPELVQPVIGKQRWFDSITNTFAHETGHIFRAADKYCEEFYCCSCSEVTGALGIPNTDCEAGCPEGNCKGGEPECRGCDQCREVDDIMRIFTWNVQTNTREQWGWRDSDGDGIFDPIDKCIINLPNQLLISLDGFVQYTIDMEGIDPEKIGIRNVKLEDRYFDDAAVYGGSSGPTHGPTICHLREDTKAWIVYGCCMIPRANKAAFSFPAPWSRIECQFQPDQYLGDSRDPRYADFDFDGKMDNYPTSIEGQDLDLYCGWNVYYNGFIPASSPTGMAILNQEQKRSSKQFDFNKVFNKKSEVYKKGEGEIRNKNSEELREDEKELRYSGMIINFAKRVIGI